MVERLSETCIALEIDTRGHEPGSAHLCDSLQKAIPRLKRLRLRLSTLRPVVFGMGFRLNGTMEEEKPTELTPAPSHQTAAINCYGGPATCAALFKKISVAPVKTSLKHKYSQTRL